IQAGYALAELEANSPPALEALKKRFATVDGPIVEPHPHVVIGFDMLADHLSSPLTDPMRHLDRVRRDKEELAILPDRYGSFLQARIHWIGPYPYPPLEPAASGPSPSSPFRRASIRSRTSPRPSPRVLPASGSSAPRSGGRRARARIRRR